jgi:hypothetical protein
MILLGLHWALSRNLLFLRGTTMDEVYQKLIDRTRKPLDLKQVKTISGFSYRPHHKAKRGRKQSEIFKAVSGTSRSKATDSATTPKG